MDEVDRCRCSDAAVTAATLAKAEGSGRSGCCGRAGAVAVDVTVAAEVVVVEAAALQAAAAAAGAVTATA